MATLPSGLPDHIADDEALARFLTSSSYFNATIVKPAAFLPRPDTVETSVFRHDAEPRRDLWALGQGIGASRSVHGAAIIAARDVRDAGLDVLPDEPPLRHANITGWPRMTQDPDLQKAQRKEKAIAIAQHARLIRC